MTPEAQRIAIAEACGWTDIKERYIESLLCVPITENSDPIISGLQPDKKGLSAIPDYPENLNAMHEVELKLNNSKDSGIYARSLMYLVCGYSTNEDCISINGWVMMRIARATASQRAEAFLKTIGKWVEDAPTNAQNKKEE